MRVARAVGQLPVGIEVGIVNRHIVGVPFDAKAIRRARKRGGDLAQRGQRRRFRERGARVKKAGFAQADHQALATHRNGHRCRLAVVRPEFHSGPCECAPDRLSPPRAIADRRSPRHWDRAPSLPVRESAAWAFPWIESRVDGCRDLLLLFLIGLGEGVQDHKKCKQQGNEIGIGDQPSIVSCPAAPLRVSCRALPACRVRRRSESHSA